MQERSFEYALQNISKETRIEKVYFIVWEEANNCISFIL